MEKAEKMMELVALWRASGMKRQEFCDQYPGLKASTLSYWVSKQNRMSSSKNFIELRELHSVAELRLTYPNGVQLCTSSSDLNFVGRLIRMY